MRYLILTFLLCCLTLPVLMIFQSEPAPAFPDGNLISSPMPGPITQDEPVLVPPQLVPAVAATENPQSSAPRLTIVDMPAETSPVAAVPRLRLNDPSDWGINHQPQPGLPPVVSVIQPRPVVQREDSAPAAPPAIASTVSVPTFTDEAFYSGPNLYLPEGATNEAGALLTLIRHELNAYSLPDASSDAAPFVLREGDQVRPLTRLRGENDFDWIKIRREGQMWWAQAEYFIRVDPRNRTVTGTGNIEIGLEAVDRTSALPPGYMPDDLVPVAREVTLEDREIRLRREAAEAFTRMAKAAEEAGLRLRVFSGFRDFNYQKKLYLDAIESKGPKQNGVAAPGYSEHQLGTTIDVSGLDRRFILRGSFADTPEGKWLAQHAGKYGFRHSYTQENMDESGYKPEPWHLRYVGVLPAPEKDALAQNQ